MRIPTTASVLLLLGCSVAEQVYTDAPDLAATRRAFRCDAPASPHAQRACAGIARFEGAGRVNAFPATGRRLYVGRYDCTDGGQSVAFRMIVLGAGESPRSPPGSLHRIDDAHQSPGQLFRASLSLNMPSEPIERGAARTMGALRQGAQLTLEPAMTDGLLPDSWPAWLAASAPARTPVSDVGQSDGRSLILSPGLTPAWWDDAEPTSPHTYLRQVEDELIELQPPDASDVACVHHTYLVPGQ